jgi:hypothetical protein
VIRYWGATKTSLIAIAIAGAAAIASWSAHAGSARMRTYLSGKGRDNPSCSAPSPCLTLQAALRLTLAGGEIFVLDTANYGPAVIDKSVSITGQGAAVGILGQNGTALSINAGPNDVVNLRGLDLDGVRTGGIGVQFISGRALVMQNSRIRDFANTGIVFNPSGPSNLFLSDVTITGNINNGIWVRSGGPYLVSAVLHRTTASRNGVAILVSGTVTNVTITHAVAANNGYGLAVASATVTLRNSLIGNNQVGIASTESAIVRLVQSTVNANATGLATGGGGAIQSYGNNNLFGNVANGIPTRTLMLQ